MDHPPRDERAHPFHSSVFTVLAAAMAAGVGFEYAAWARLSVTLGVTGVALLLAAPPIAVAASIARDPLPRPPALATAHDLIDGIEHADTSLWLIRMTRAHAGVAAASICLMWVCEAYGMVHVPEFVAWSTALVVTAVTAYLPWLARQEVRARGRRDTCRRMLDDVSVADRWFAG